MFKVFVNLYAPVCPCMFGGLKTHLKTLAPTYHNNLFFWSEQCISKDWEEWDVNMCYDYILSPL